MWLLIILILVIWWLFKKYDLLTLLGSLGSSNKPQPIIEGTPEADKIDQKMLDNWFTNNVDPENVPVIENTY
jgi:hypothetical protein